jgi:hypothetical protein
MLVRVTADPGESSRLVEGAKPQKTPKEIALTVLLAELTLIFVIRTYDFSRPRCACGARRERAGRFACGNGDDVARFGHAYPNASAHSSQALLEFLAVQARAVDRRVRRSRSPSF